jgi:hypothetical protein
MKGMTDVNGNKYNEEKDFKEGSLHKECHD